MMSHLHGRALTEKQNVLHVFSKHFKSTDKTCSPTNRSTPHCCSSSHTKNTEAQNSQTNKTKRLKTRKERSQVSRGGSISRSHQHQSSKEKDHCHGCCQSSSRPPPRRDAPLARVFPAGQEPSITNITNNRLIGHHGLFNHEVKSIDIERLLSEQRKLEKLGQRGGRGKTTATLPPLPPSSSLPFSSPGPDSDVGEVAVPDNVEEDPDKGRVERVVAKSSTKANKRYEYRSNSESRLFKCSHGDTQEDFRRKFTSIQVSLEKNVASHSNSQESGITPGQTHHSGLTSSEGGIVTLLSTESPSRVVRNKSKGPRPVVCETLLSPSGKNENKRPPDTRAEVKPVVLTLEQTPKNHGPILPHTQPFRPSPNITVSSFPARGGSSESSDNQMQQTVTNPVSVVAARLCRSLQLPLLHRRHLVAESREVLLQALRERHGLQLQENLLNVQRRLSFSTGPTTTRAGLGQSTILAGVDAYGGWPAAPLDGGFEDSMVEHPCLDSQRSAPSKRRRKQLCPNRMTPQPLIGSQNSLDTAAAWNPNPSVEQVGELIGELLRPASSSHFLMDLQPSGSPSRHHVFAPPPASPWAAQSGLRQSWDDVFDRGSMRESTRVDHFENWRDDPDLSFLNQTETVRERISGPFYHEKSMQCFLQYPTGPPEGHRDRHLPQQQDPYDIERSHFGGSSSSFSALTHYPLDSHQLHPFYRFNRRPPTSPVISRSHLPDMAYYPPSHMLESGLSPPMPPGSLPAFPSPECWSFPRMRLY
ncbi:proline-rich protein 19 [Salmo salar]|uniref:Uncharacterized protein si:dkey-250k15.4 n=1 Tax=Salmo salar TaxID=8030 RepID=A0A1S3NDZ5_SALSA|nr:uncharacterized protein si:dkey-250k15.4 [Salmo salar]XP_045556708.1 uncharacterized protein si:dkey-250k15.4 [Salmo salar]